MRRHRHPHGVQERRTTEQLAKAKPGLKKWCRNPKRFRNPRLLKSLRATKRLLKPRLLKPRSLKRRLLKPRLLKPGSLKPRSLNAARLPMPPRKSPRCAAAVNGIAAVPRTATAARATIDLRIMLLLLLACWFSGCALAPAGRAPVLDWIRACC